MIDRREDPEDKAQWREPANREPPEFDAHVYVASVLCNVFGELDMHGFNCEESKAIIEEVIENEF
jgi:hypothetical protein